jgi:hypothetical protein
MARKRQFAQAQDFLEIVGGKSRLSRELRNLRGIEFHGKIRDRFLRKLPRGVVYLADGFLLLQSTPPLKTSSFRTE